jgi:hypothetical protein
MAVYADIADGPDADSARAIIRKFARQHLAPEEAAAFQ